MIVAISSSVLDPNPILAAFNKRPLVFLEQSIIKYAASFSVAPFILPTTDPSLVDSYLDLIDGLILSGGTDISPEVYGEQLIKEEWKGNLIRDQFEMSLCKKALSRKIPVLGICRGMQIINIVQGGTIYQDNNYFIKDALIHRSQELYEKNQHSVVFSKGGYLEKLYQSRTSIVNSVHHQSLKTVGSDLSIEAISPQDKIVEAIKLNSENYCLGVQWHPEFSSKNKILDPQPLIKDFYNTIKRGLK
jgi:putative glutamine amidotransferase